jgi:hypothetical protein
MAKLAGRHPFHEVAYGLRLCASHDFAGHDLMHRLAKRAGAAFGEGSHDISLGQYAGDLPVRSGNHDRPDAVFGQRPNRVRERCRCCNRYDVAAFSAHNSFYRHGHPPRNRPMYRTRPVTRRNASPTKQFDTAPSTHHQPQKLTPQVHADEISYQ